jgi:hypothetical protein
MVLKFVQWWKKCIEKQEDCVEKWCYYKSSIFIEIKFVSVLRIIIDSFTYIAQKFLKYAFAGLCVNDKKTCGLFLPVSSRFYYNEGL